MNVPDPTLPSHKSAAHAASTILVVDDEPDVLRATAHILEEAGFPVLTGSRAAEVLELTRRHHPTLLVLDVELGDGNGVDVARQIKSDPTLADVFVILVSGKRISPDSQAAGLDEGLADGYIARPFNKNEFLARIDAFLRLSDAQRQLRKARDELEQRVIERTAELTLANLELEQSRDAAQAANRAKTAFLNQMSHEMHTPLHAILGMTELAQGDPLSAEQQEYLANVMDAGKSLLTMVNEILELSRMEAGTLVLTPEAFDLPAQLADAMQPFAISAQQRGLQLAWQVQPGVPRMVVGDQQRLRQILASLVSNAIKFTQQGSVAVDVAVEVTEESAAGQEVVLHFAVRDTGIGIAEDRRAAIFEMFEQGDTSLSRCYGGAGLGLAIASRLVYLMGGRIWVESEVGRGSCFHFTTRLCIAPEIAKT